MLGRLFLSPQNALFYLEARYLPWFNSGFMLNFYKIESKKLRIVANDIIIKTVDRQKMDYTLV